MRVLIAEDDLTSRLLLKKVLEKWGYEVVVTTDGAEAWELLRNDDSPRLVVLDWMMPEMDGVEVCRRVRALDTHQPPYIILLTALGEQDHVIAGLGAGADDFVGKPYDPAELRARVEVGRRLVELNAELIAVQLRLEEQAHTDALTGLLNRGAIVERLEIEFERADREGGDIGIGMADIDHFKRVNDTHGHAAGDAVLRELAGRMESALRPYDSLGRFGGEEFLILVPGASHPELAEVLERVRAAVAASPVAISQGTLVVSVSLGGVMREGEAVDALIARADEALYAAKANGRDQVVMLAPGATSG
jgi:two-component system, cell cycle response regulator